MKKVLFLVPHLSTGGMPQYTYDLMEKIKDDVDTYCVEYSMVSPDFVVQRNRIINLLGNKFFCLGDDKTELFSIIDKINPEIIHFQEMPEYFMDDKISKLLYSDNRGYTIVETSHDSSFDVTSKRFYPDHFALISQYQKIEFSKLGIPISIVEADIEYKERQDRTDGLIKLGLDPNLKHVLNVGLFTPRKNQAEVIEYARKLEGYPIQFHFVGNQADNFKSYWEPLLRNLPSNVKIWGERSDVDNFYSCMDLMLFTSRGTGNDKETSPLVIREAIGYNLTSLIYNLPVYLNMYDSYKTVKYLNESSDANTELILQTLGINKMNDSGVFYTINGVIDFNKIDYPNSMYETIQKYGDASGMWWGTVINDELNRGKVSIQQDDIFVDLGSNIGISSYHALKLGAKKVYCFEPDPKICSLLRKNITNNIKVFEFAISNNRHNIELYHWPYNEINVGPKYTSKTITLDDVFQYVGEPIIDYLKMDIEGFEENVFDGVSKNAMNRIRKIFIEHHYPETTEVIAEKIKNFGFEVQIEYGNGQNYLYCLNKKIERYNKKIGSVWYDNTSNKINYTLNTQISDAIITVRDIDSHTVIWSAKHDLIPNSEYWMIPLPKEYYDFEKEINFGGFIFDVYVDDNLIYTESFRIKIPQISKPITRTINDTEPTFINYNEFFCQKIYDKYLKDKKFDTVIDIGANIGLWTEYIDAVSEVQKVYMVEPNKNALQVMYNSFGYSEKFVVSPFAISHMNGKLEFFVNETNSTVSSMMESHRNTGGATGGLNQTYFVDSLNFNSFMIKNNIKYADLVKIDIEGAEYNLIDSMDLYDFNRIGNILLEYHLSSEKTMDDVRKLIQKFESFGFYCELNSVYEHGGFIFATKSGKNRRKIQAIHLLTNISESREKKSVEYISKLSDYGVNYKQQFNKIYDELPPTEFCNRPNDISEKNESIGNGYGKLTGRHYGCYLAHINAIKNIDDEYDYTLIFEGDANIETSYEEFLDMVESCCKQSELDDVYFFGLSNNFSPQETSVNDMFNNTITQNLAHAYLIPNRHKKWYLERISDVPWDVADIWLNEVFLRHNKNRYATKKCYSSQLSGPSLIDNVFKWEDNRQTHFDYVEIGTSDFETLIEIMPEDFKGISVEPIIEYLDHIENRPNKIKANIAISDRDTETNIYYVDESDIQKYNLPSWVKGCNSIDFPHRSVSELIKERGLPDIISTRKIETISFQSFVKRFNIESIGLLKIDTEGHDFVILRDMIKTNIRPKKIHFEANSLYSEEEIQSIIFELQEVGYHLTQRTTIDITMSFMGENYFCFKKPILIISTGRRFLYFKKTIEELIKKNPDLSTKIERVWVLDDRSSPEDRMNMDKLMSSYFGDNYNSIYLNSNEKFYFVEKFKMIRNLISKDDVVFLMEDDWECHDNLRLDFHVNSLIKSNWTQIAFADPLYIQDDDIIKKYMINFDYWKNPYPDLFKHPHKWDSDVCYWNKCYINNWTNNPSLIKAEVFFKSQFQAGHGFEQNFANELNGNQVFTNECLFRHFGENSLINNL